MKEAEHSSNGPFLQTKASHLNTVESIRLSGSHATLLESHKKWDLTERICENSTLGIWLEFLSNPFSA